jgi:capsular polysaccharide transport system permease protein
MFVHLKSQSPLGGSPVLFYATGFFTNYFFIYLSRRMKRTIDAPNRRFPVEQTLDYIIVHVILSTFDYAVLGIILFGRIYVFFSDQALPYDFVPVLESCAAIVMLGFGWGVMNLVISRISWFWKFVFPPLNRFLILFSGIFFIIDFLPPHIRYVLSFNPMMQAISLFRLGFYRNQPTLVLDIKYLAYCAIMAVFFGLALERVMRRGER